MMLFPTLIVASALVQSAQLPAVEFPQAGLDDPAAYDGYATRFFRDSSGNTVQIYVKNQIGRVVHVWADASNASAGFTARSTSGKPANLAWGSPDAQITSHGTIRSLRYRLTFDQTALDIGWFALGTMRQERDLQYWEVDQQPFGGSPFVLDELGELVRNLATLPTAERQAHLELLDAVDLPELESRLAPRAELNQSDTSWTFLVEQESLDGRNRMTLAFHGDARVTSPRLVGDVLSVRSQPGKGIDFDVEITTDALTLVPLDRETLFNAPFDAFFERQRARADSLSRTLTSEQLARDARHIAFLRFDREIRGLELLSSEEKLMAGLPNYATYFGRDMMMTALMLESIGSVELQESVIASVLRKLTPSGHVSHEEALGGQAIREAAAEYNAHVRAWNETRERNPEAAAQHLAEARALLRDPQTVRENYHMVDDDFQLAVLAARYLARTDIAPARKRRFLTEPASDRVTRLQALLSNLAFAAELARPYAANPAGTNLVEFYNRDDQGWLPGSWRDSRVGYGLGRYAMDVNVVWVPRALEAMQTILEAVTALGLSAEEAVAQAEESSTLRAHIHDPRSLSATIEAWRGARQHFEVRLEPDEIRARVTSALDSMPAANRAYWRDLVAATAADRRSISFLALALDSVGEPIPAVNTDPATELFLGDYTEQILEGTRDPVEVIELLDTFVRPYPVGLHVREIGPLVVNDVYASPMVQSRFRSDLYHSPSVVWGREVNLLFLGLARQIEAAYDSSGRLRSDTEVFREYVGTLRTTLATTRAAVEASGLRQAELWSYRIEGDTLKPVRYATGTDIQLWNVTDLAVRFLIDALPAEEAR